MRPYTVRKALRIPTILVPLALWLGCSSSSIAPQFAGLVNQGMLSLSDKNPFLGSNLFLAKEAEKSSYLYHFLEQHGAPSAIELRDSSRGDVQIHLYYGRDNELYIADNSGNRLEWIVRGPYGVNRANVHELRRIAKEVKTPVFELWGKQRRFGKQLEETKVTTTVLVPLPPPTPTPKPKPRRPRKVITAAGTPAAPTPNAALPQIPINSDQQALAEARSGKKPAEPTAVVAAPVPTHAEPATKSEPTPQAVVTPVAAADHHHSEESQKDSAGSKAEHKSDHTKAESAAEHDARSHAEKSLAAPHAEEKAADAKEH